MINRIVRAFVGAVTVLFLLPTGVHAEQFKDFGEYKVHYNTINTSFLSAQVARQYGIQRSDRRAMLSLTVQRKEGDKTVPVKADIEARATNLTGQLRQVSLRAVEDGEAIYYIGEFGIENEEVLNFQVDLKPQGTSDGLSLQFREQFYVR